MLDTTLDFFTKGAWTLFIIALALLFLRTVIQEGLVAAFGIFASRFVAIGLLLLLSISAVNESLIFVQPQQVGVVVSLFSPEGVRDQPFRSGLRWIIPLAEEMYLYPIYWQTYTMSGRPLEGQEVGDDAIIARTSDGQEVIIDCSAIFRVQTDQAIRIHIEWQDRYISDFVRPMIRGIVRTEVSQFTIDEINSSKRRDLERSLELLVRQEMEDKGFVLDQFLVRNITFSDIYAISVEQKQVALQDITRNEHVADQIRRLAEGRADEVVRLAEAEATAIFVRAEAQAEALELIAAAVAENPDLLTYEYIDKIAPGVRVMILPNDNPFILPLPNLDDETNSASTLPVATPSLLDEAIDSLQPSISEPIAPAIPPSTPAITVTVAPSATPFPAPTAVP